MIGIYKISNNINGKIYIGQSKSIESRLLHHISNLKRGKHSSKFQEFYNENENSTFHLSVLEYVEESGEILKKERYWINYLNSIDDGFNIGGRIKVKPEIPIKHVFKKDKYDNDFFKDKIIYSTNLNYTMNDDLDCIKDFINNMNLLNLEFNVIGLVNRKLVLMQDKIFSFIKWSNDKLDSLLSKTIKYTVLSTDELITLYTSSGFGIIEFFPDIKMEHSITENFITIYKNFIGENDINNIYFIKNYSDFIENINNELNYRPIKNKEITEAELFISKIDTDNNILNILYNSGLIK